MVITLSGSVLFRSNDATLLPGAQTRLNQVAEALVRSQGPRRRGRGLHRLARLAGHQHEPVAAPGRSVRAHLVSRGFPGENPARGMGPDKPIAENTNAEGRANNRRVEMVVRRRTAWRGRDGRRGSKIRSHNDTSPS